MQGTLTADGSSRWFKVINGPIHIAVSKVFGGGTVTIEQEIQGQVVDLLNSGSAITFTAASDDVYSLHRGDMVRVTLAGASSPAMLWSITGS